MASLVGTTQQRTHSVNLPLLKSTAVAGLGGLLFGFDTAVIAGVTRALTELFRLSPATLGLTVAIALWGTIVGALFAGLPGDRYGRRDSLKGLGCLFFVSALGCAFSWNWISFVSFRFIAGLAIGGSSVLGPMYIAEIAPAKWRGRLVGFFQFSIVFGILLAYFSNFLIGGLRLGEAEWRWKIGVSCFPAVLFFLLLFYIPRSPRWLAKKGRIAEARQVLSLIGEPNVDEELQQIVDSLSVEKANTTQRLFSRRYRFPVLLAVLVAMFNQLAGINSILYYVNDIFERAGFTRVSGDIQAIIIGATNLLFHDDRDVRHRQTRPQEDASHRFGRNVWLPGRCRLISSKRTHTGTCCSLPSSDTLLSSPFRKEQSSGCTSARSFQMRSVPKDRVWDALHTGS